MDPLDLSIVIVNFNALGYVRRLLLSLNEGAAGVRWEAIVVDNGSRERGTDALPDEYRNVCVLALPRNRGFAVGANAGMREARAPAVLLLNPDTRVFPGAVATLLRYAREQPDIGILGPKIVNPDGSLQLSCRGFPTLWTGLFNRYSLLTRLMPRNRHADGYLMTGWDHAGARDVDWLSGAAMLIPRIALDRVGMFDDTYFFAIEDVDLCRRMHDAGLRVVYLPDAVIEHRIGGSSSTVPVRIAVERHRGMWRYYRRHLRRGRATDLAVASGIIGRCLVQVALVTGGRAVRTARARARGVPASDAAD